MTPPGREPEAPSAPAGLSPAACARLLTRTGGAEIAEADIVRDLEAGAPREPDGSINLIAYCAWLIHQDRHAH